MKKLSIISGLAVLLLSMAAQATQFQAEYTVNANTGDGLIISTSDVADNPFSFDLMAGESTTFDLFNISTPEGTVNGDDTDPQTISVDFAFLLPAMFDGSVSGTTQGTRAVFGLIQNGKVSWNNPGSFFYGPQDDGEIQVSLSDETFFKNPAGVTLKNGANVEATFTLVNDATVPEPGALALFGLALIGIGFAVRRRQSSSEL